MQKARARTTVQLKVRRRFFIDAQKYALRTGWSFRLENYSNTGNDAIELNSRQ